MATSSHTVVLL